MSNSDSEELMIHSSEDISSKELLKTLIISLTLQGVFKMFSIDILSSKERTPEPCRAC